ncbi:MAG: M48 family metalloprotease, partial [Acidobacteriia bacterium]|nr:M48 family metalloprotease [Terriglobia bacterium]
MGVEASRPGILPGWAYGSRTVPTGYQHTRLTICICVVLGILRMNASDLPASCASVGAEQTANSASSTSHTARGSEEKTEKSGRNDVDCIGQRNTGKGVNLYSLERERSLGQAMAAAFDSQTKFVTDPNIRGYINRLAQKVVRNSDAQVAFTVKVIDSPNVRTFALPGGFLYVDKGLIMEVDSEAELAGLMAHEIAHVAARHATRLATRKYTWNVISIPLTYIAGPAALGAKQIGLNGGLPQIQFTTTSQQQYAGQTYSQIGANSWLPSKEYSN